MKYFIKKLFLFFIPILLLLYPLDLILSKFISKIHNTAFLADELSVWNDIYENNINSDIAIYGSSRAWVQFNPLLITDSLGYDTYNFGIDGHNFWLQYFRHQEYLKNNKAPKVIILSVDFATLQKRKDLYNYGQFLPYMLWNKDIENSTSSYIGFKETDFNIPLFRYFGKFNILKDGITASLAKNNTLKRTKGYQGVERQWNDDLEKAKDNKNYTIVFDEETIELFKKFLDECASKNITVLMIYAPIYHEGLEFIENHEENMELFRNISKTYEIEFIDYTMSDISFNKEYFYNSSHLNKTGSELFTNLLIKDLKNSESFHRLKP